MIYFIGKIKVAQILIEKGADINSKGNDGQTALQVASFASQTKMAEYLIEKGADIETKDNAGLTPLHYSALTGVFDHIQQKVDQFNNNNCVI